VHLARGDQLIHDDAGQVDRDGEAIPGTRSIIAELMPMTSPFTLTAGTGVAGIDGSVGLNEVGDGGLYFKPCGASLPLMMPEVTVKVN
jgi:hypothetical protein